MGDVYQHINGNLSHIIADGSVRNDYVSGIVFIFPF